MCYFFEIYWCCGFVSESGYVCCMQNMLCHMLDVQFSTLLSIPGIRDCSFDIPS